MQIDRKKVFTLFALTLLITSLLLVNTPVQAQEQHLYWKPSYPDYAPSGMPDFNQRQDQWNMTGQWTWCAPTAVANSLWWLDSELHPSNLVTAYPGAVSEHDPSNVMPLISDLAWWMDTDGQSSGIVHVGTWTVDIQKGINQYLINHGVSNQFYVQLVNFPNFTYVENEVEKCEDVVLVLGFWMWTGTTWYRPTQEYEQGSGHCVTVAGINSTTLKIAISDPDNDAFEAGLTPGRSPVSHPYPHNSSVHNNASLVSQDIYNVNVTLPVQPPIPVGTWALKGYNVAGAPLGTIAVVEAAVITSPLPPPQQPELYWKPSYPDYAPSGMPDFNQRQDQWNMTGQWTWCAPTAVANSLWWLDSELHPSNLVTAYPGAVSEHDPSNVMPFITHLSYLMDTDGQRTHVAHVGTWTWDMETGIAQYLSWTGVNPQGDVNGDRIVNMTDYNLVNAMINGTIPPDMRGDIWPVTTGWPNVILADNVVDANDLALVTANMNKTGKFYEQTWMVPDFDMVEAEVEKCEDVILLLGFYSFDEQTQTWTRCPYDYPPAYPLGSGHAVTVAGINSTTLKIAISDPDNDAFEAGLTPGRSPVSHPYPHNSSVHNNASLVSQDIYDVTILQPPLPPGLWALQGYVGAPLGYPIAVVEAAVITSPLAVEVCDIAVTNVTAWHPCSDVVVTQAHQRWVVRVKVTVKNNGNQTCNATVNAYYYNGTTWIQIGSSQNVTLAPSANTTLTFNWNTTTVPYCTSYTLKANVTATNCTDTYSGNDEYVNGQVKVKIRGDVDNNSIVFASDMVRVLIAFGQSSAQYPQEDVDGNCQVFASDMVIILINFGQTCP